MQLKSDPFLFQMIFFFFGSLSGWKCPLLLPFFKKRGAILYFSVPTGTHGATYKCHPWPSYHNSVCFRGGPGQVHATHAGAYLSWANLPWPQLTEECAPNNSQDSLHVLKQSLFLQFCAINMATRCLRGHRNSACGKSEALCFPKLYSASGALCMT